MTKEEIISKFPVDNDFCEIERGDVESLFEIAMQAKTYNNICSIIYDYFKNNLYDPMKNHTVSEKKEVFPGVYYNKTLTKEEYSNNRTWWLHQVWYYGWYDWNEDNYKRYQITKPTDDFVCVDKWSKLVEDYYKEFNGKIRTLEEAAEIVADKWTELVFKKVMQDPNGLSCIKENSDNTFFSSALGSMLKEDCLKNVSDEQINLFRKNVYEFYLTNDRKMISVDYHPDYNLFEIFKKCGISERDADGMAPWKTVISIDTVDNSIRYNHSYI